MRFVFVRTPWQPIYHAVYAAFVGVLVRKRHHRHRPLAPLFPDPRRAVGPDGGLAALSGRRAGPAATALSEARRPDPAPLHVRRRQRRRLSAERSAARLAHQSGGLGVPSSNLGAPTNHLIRCPAFSRSFRWSLAAWARPAMLPPDMPSSLSSPSMIGDCPRCARAAATTCSAASTHHTLLRSSAPATAFVSATSHPSRSHIARRRALSRCRSMIRPDRTSFAAYAASSVGS